jgi:hexokinase
MTLRRYASWVLRLCEPPTSGVEMKDKDGGKLAEQLSLEVEVEKWESISEVAERVKKEFDFSEEDVMRAVEGFMKQMS